METESNQETDPPPARRRKKKASPRKKVSRIQKTLEQGFVLDKKLVFERPESKPVPGQPDECNNDIPVYTDDECGEKNLYSMKDKYNSMQTFEEQELTTSLEHVRECYKRDRKEGED